MTVRIVTDVDDLINACTYLRQVTVRILADVDDLTNDLSASSIGDSKNSARR